MPEEFRLPKLAESVVEGEIIRWFVPEGGRIEKDAPLVEVMTDKVTVELPSPLAGTVVQHLVQEGDLAQIGDVLAMIEPGAGGTTPEAEAAEVDDSPSLFKSTGPADDGPTVEIRRPQANAAAPAAPRASGRVLAVPAARKLARDLGVDIEQVTGSGPLGRVRVGDVEASRRAPAPGGTGLGVPPVQYRTPDGYESRETREKLRGIRRATSQQMQASHLHTVRALHVDEADVSGLVELRRSLKPAAEKEGVRLSYLPFIMKAVVASLKKFPVLNTSLDEERQEIVSKDYWNFGLAVATDTGLVVPVIRDVDQLNVLELAGAIGSVAEKARSGKLATEDIRGGTFSITNIGSVGGLFSFPIINAPEAAILGVHSIKRRPVVLEDDSIVARDMLYLSLSFDHRLVDGAEAAMFTSHLISLLETPGQLMLHMR